MGWDGLALRDPCVDVVDMCRRYVEAVQSESCGRCIPCRVGTRIVLDVMTAHRRRAGQAGPTSKRSQTSPRISRKGPNAR